MGMGVHGLLAAKTNLVAIGANLVNILILIGVNVHYITHFTVNGDMSIKLGN